MGRQVSGQERRMEVWRLSVRPRKFLGDHLLMGDQLKIYLFIYVFINNLFILGGFSRGFFFQVDDKKGN